LEKDVGECGYSTYCFRHCGYGFLGYAESNALRVSCPGAEGYYQRMVLDRLQRNQMRMLGMIFSFFGLAMLTGVLSGRLSSRILDAISDGMLVLLWISFTSAFMFGIIYSAVQIFRGRWKELFSRCFDIYKRGTELGPIDVSPTITPRMRRESIAFTVIYSFLIGVTLVVALVAR
jgi:hypothetical protein